MDGTDIRPHDRGLKRAYRFHCCLFLNEYIVVDSTKDGMICCNPYKTLFVGRLKLVFCIVW